MSDFFVRVETIDQVWHHPNADKLDIATLKGIGFQFVVGRDQYKPADEVLYFPLDAIMPDVLATKLGLLGKLAGKARNRIKTIKLRGEISQGLVGPVSILGDPEYQTPECQALKNEALLTSIRSELDVADPDYAKPDWAPMLGVIKYEPEEVTSGGPNQAGIRMNPLPPEVHKYDIESCQRYQSIVDLLMNEQVVITEKLEGSHVALLHRSDGTEVVCSRNCTIVEPDTSYHKGLQNCKTKDWLDKVVSIYDGHNVTIRGELLGPGVQGNLYGLTTHQVRAFELEIDGRPIDAEHFYQLLDDYIYVAPVLWQDGTLGEWLEMLGLPRDSKSLAGASNGKSVLVDKLREGIVIKPKKEQFERRLGRVFLKQRSPEYLCKHET